MSALIGFPIPVILKRSKRPTILSANPLVLRAMMAETSDELDRAMAITGRCLADALAHHEPNLVMHWQDILLQQFEVWQRWRPPTQEPEPRPKPRRGRRKGSYEIPNNELVWMMYDAHLRYFAKHPHSNELTQEDLLQEMGRHPSTDTKRVREWCDRLKIVWEVFKRRA